MLRVDGDVIFKAGNLNLIIGPTASGKTCVLLALLGELHHVPTGLDSWYNLPRDKGVSYCAQEPWILNETIKVALPTFILWNLLRLQSILGEYSVWSRI